METLALVCRVCLECKTESNSLFDEVQYDSYVKLTTLYKKVTTFEVEYIETNILDTEAVKPTRLCHECTERLLNAYEFVCAVENAEKEIERYINEINESDVAVAQLEQCEYIDQDDVADVVLDETELLEDQYISDIVDIPSPNVANELNSDEEIFVENSTETQKELSISKEEDKEKKPKTNIVGSRLSKRKSANYLKCNSCQRSFAKTETLMRHIKIAHTVAPNNTAQSSENGLLTENRITCTSCPQFFKRRNNYIRHLITCHPKEAESLTPEDRELAKNKQNYKKGICPHCGESFTQASLIIHIRRHTGVNPYECDQCDKAFPRRQDLNIHQRQHTGERPHICTVCGKSFSRANKLARHMRIHTGERPYKCTKCERSFTQSNDLKIHTRRHTGEKPYKCSVCSEAFICGAALKAHRRQKNHHTPEDDNDDPFANWRVSKRKIKTNVSADLEQSGTEICIEKEDVDQYQEYLDVEYTFGEESVKIEPAEITDVLQ